MIVTLSLVTTAIAQVTIVMLLALTGARLARRNRAAARHVILASGFAALLLVPPVSAIVPPLSVRVAVPIAPVERRSALQPAGAETVVATAAESPAPASPRPAAWPSWPVLALGVWGLGALLFLLPVFAGLRQILQMRRSGLPARRAQTIADALTPRSRARRVDVLQHECVPGPMTCGVVRPAIVLPVESEHWPDQDLERALVHELAHVRRRDRVTQCAARVGCALYWFHPLVWIAWRELSLEAERACDDEVLRSPSHTGGGADPAEYAGQLVLLAERLSASNPPALAMANRTDLAARVRAVLDSRLPRGRAGTRWIAMAACVTALLVIATSSFRIVAIAAAAATQTAPDTRKFDVISIRPCESEPPTPPGQRSSQGGFPQASPGRFTIECGTVERMIGTAYVRYGEPLTNQAARIGDVEWLKNVPSWLRSEKFTIEAKAEGTPDQSVMLGPMLRNLLEDRFQLKIHRETDQAPMYVMTVAQGGLKITTDTCTKRDPANPPTIEDLRAATAAGKPVCGSMNMGGTAELKRWTIGGATMKSFAGTLSTFMDHHVVDQTNVEGSFNIRLDFSLDEHVPGPDKRYGPPTEFPAPEGPNIFKALEQQLGLHLEPTKGPHGFLVIDRVERPSPNR